MTTSGTRHDETVMERLDDLELARIVKDRLESGETPVSIPLEDLIAEAEDDIGHGQSS